VFSANSADFIWQYRIRTVNKIKQKQVRCNTNSDCVLSWTDDYEVLGIFWGHTEEL
jgi:hypothetical protein